MPRRETTAVIDSPAPVIDRPAPVAAPRPPVTPPPAPLPVAAEVIARRAAELAAAEQLFVKQVAGESLTPDELEFLRHLWPSEFDRSREMSRIARYRKLQRTAGSPAERTAAEQAAQETAARLAEDGPPIREQIAALQASLQALETAADVAAKEHDRRIQAVEALHDPALLGEPFRSRYEAARQRWEKDYGSPLRSKRNEAAGLLQRAGWDAERDVDAIGGYAQSKPELNHLVTLKIQNIDPSLRTEDIRDKRAFIVNRPAWQTHAVELRAKAEQLAAEAEQLEQAGQQARAEELDAMLASLIPA